ncbi:histidine kinase [Muricauda sp. 334s03]|uniref:Histidine kinase n=1 Tax=Flagellimonas yonaguniensis TaxID=3031325 RepID=A0ABT5Y2J9_9FLAO|nr:histidine kinase [[Muricauda] yonaguniensis]MDF0717677.1 histidine kinase [[Muricauda] yonaguniensis]
MKQLSETTINSIKSVFNFGFILVMALHLSKRAFDLLPDNWLFFITSDAMENFIAICIAYLLYFYVFHLDSLWKKVGYVLISGLVLLGLALLKDFRTDDIIFFDDTFGYFTGFLGRTLLFYLLLYFINKLDDLNNYKKLRDELKTAKAQLLRNQMHPHFLYNAFNSLYSLSLKKREDVSAYILKLSGMMRYLTDDAELGKVPIGKELDFIEKYIAIEKLRFGKDSAIEFNGNKTLMTDRFIEPFLMIPLVENAFKHGFYTNSKEAYVSIQYNLDGNELLFSVKNSIARKQHFQENNRTGKGLDNLKQRLDLLYKGNASLALRSDSDSYTAKLKITLD